MVMAKFKKKNLPAAPTTDDGSLDVIDQDENQQNEQNSISPVEEVHAQKINARAKTGRTIPFSTKVSAEFRSNLKLSAFKSDKKMVVVMEEALNLYMKKHKIT